MPSLPHLPPIHALFRVPLTRTACRKHKTLLFSMTYGWPTMDWLSQKTEQYFGIKNSIVFKVVDRLEGYGIFAYPFVGPTIPPGVNKRVAARVGGTTLDRVRRLHAETNGFLPGGYLDDSFPLSSLFRTAAYLYSVPQLSPFISEIRPNVFVKLEKSPLARQLERTLNS